MKGQTILIVESDHDAARHYVAFFEGKYEVLMAFTGRQALRHAREAGEIDLAILEYRLPDLDGLSLLKSYGNRQPGAVKFLIAAYLSHQVAEEVVRAGIHDVIRKPFTVERLENSLQRHFRQTRGRAEDPVTAG